MSFGDLEKGDYIRKAPYSGGYQSSSPPITSPQRGNAMQDDALYNKVTNEIQTISSNVAQIQKFISQLGTQKDTEELRDKLANLNEKTRDLVQQTSKDIQNLSSKEIDDKDRKRQGQKLTKDFGEVLKRYQEIQKISAQKQREFIAQQKRKTETMKIEASQYPGEDFHEENQKLIQDDLRKQQIVQLESEIEFNEAMIAEREEGILEIEAQMAQVNEIFKDLSFMVKEQGETLDTIESNVSSVVDNTDGARTELTGASEYQKSARNKMCCLLVIVAIVLAVLVVVLVLTLK